MSGVIAVLGVAAVVCVSSAVAGELLQDFKVGYILGGTPRSIQITELIAVVVASLVMYFPLMILYQGNINMGGTGFGDKALSARLEKIRVAASHLMGIPGSAATPKIAMVTAPVDTVALDGTRYAANAYDVVARAISMGNCHRAFPLTSSMCLAVAARIEGTLVHECSTAASAADVRLGHPSGVLPLDAAVARQGGAYVAERVTVYRTARRLMEGWVRIP